MMKTIEDKKEVSTRLEDKEIQALFNLFNGKPESTTRILPKPVIIEISDLFTLNEMMNEKLEQYKINCLINSINISFENNTYKSFTNWDDFEKYTKNLPHVIDTLILKWDFMIKFDQYGMPQRHTMIVRISSSIKPEQVFQMLVNGTIEDLDKIDESLAPIMCSVSFVNNLVSEELINIVYSWNKGLKSFKGLNKNFEFLRRKKRLIANIIKDLTKGIGVLIFTAIIIFCTRKFEANLFSEITMDNFRALIVVVGSSLIGFSIMSKIAKFLASGVLGSLSNYGEIFTFKITKGDFKKQDEVKENNKKTEKRVIGTILTSILLNIACSVIATIICNYLF